jgi:hypothetical protein
LVVVFFGHLGTGNHALGSCCVCEESWGSIEGFLRFACGNSGSFEFVWERRRRRRRRRRIYKYDGCRGIWVGDVLCGGWCVV